MRIETQAYVDLGLILDHSNCYYSSATEHNRSQNKWNGNDHSAAPNILFIADADDVKMMLHSPAQGDTGEDISPDVQQHAANGDPVYPSILATALQDKNPDDDDDNG